MLEAVVLWNEPNNLSHWNFHLDPKWARFAEMAKLGAASIRAVDPTLPIVLGGVSSGDPDFLRLMRSYGVMESVDAVAIHGFPLDWNQWGIDEWPAKIAEAEQVAGRPVWVTEVGLCQWFHFEDHRLDSAVAWMKAHHVRYLRTGLSWADSFRPNAEAWFDRMMEALEPFQVALTLCFTPGHLGLEDHHTSPPKDVQGFADFAEWAVRRYGPRGQQESTISAGNEVAVIA